MRVNHVGEVCAQALYTAQASVTRDPFLRAHLLDAAREEGDHLAWTRERLAALDGALMVGRTERGGLRLLARLPA